MLLCCYSCLLGLGAELGNNSYLQQQSNWRQMSSYCVTERHKHQQMHADHLWLTWKGEFPGFLEPVAVSGSLTAEWVSAKREWELWLGGRRGSDGAGGDCMVGSDKVLPGVDSQMSHADEWAAHRWGHNSLIFMTKVLSLSRVGKSWGCPIRRPAQYDLPPAGSCSAFVAFFHCYSHFFFLLTRLSAQPASKFGCHPHLWKELFGTSLCRQSITNIAVQVHKSSLLIWI